MCQRLIHSWDLPLLPAEVGEADDALLVDDEEARALAEGDHGALNVVQAEDLALRVGEAGEGNVVELEVTAGVFEGVGGDGEELGASILELFVPFSQLREMPAAERSREAAQEDEDDGFSAEGGKGDVLVVDGGEGEVGGFGADGDGVAVDGHGGLDDRLGRPTQSNVNVGRLAKSGRCRARRRRAIVKRWLFTTWMAGL